jgi:hypothetical protein
MCSLFEKGASFKNCVYTGWKEGSKYSPICRPVFTRQAHAALRKKKSALDQQGNPKQAHSLLFLSGPAQPNEGSAEIGSKVALGSDNKTQLASGDSAKLTVDPDARARKNPTAQPATSPFQLVRSSSRPNRVRPPARRRSQARRAQIPPLLTSGGGGHGVAGAARQDAAPPELPQPLAHRPHQRHPGRLPL